MSDKVKCSKCAGTDFTPGGKCRRCQKDRNDAYRAKHAGGGSAVKTKNAKASKVKPAAAVPPASEWLEIEQGYGLRANIDEQYLMVEQDDGKGKTDAICISRTEFRQLVEKFGPWAAASP